MVGKRIGQYRVLDRLGNGGMGAVYCAIDEMLDRPVALKILEADLDDSSNRFRAEAAALARLNHAGIATLYELLEDDGRLVMVMELVRGQTLHQIVEHIGVLSAQRAAELCMQALEALSHAHSAGVVHRDLKPSNLMLTETGTIKILDFGIARLEGAVHLTRAGSMMGTPAYMAPEQVLGTVIDARTDLYAMGVVFYRLICGELPFRGDTPFEMAQAHVKDPPTPINMVRPDLPPWASEIIARALAKEPEKRFQTAIEFHEALARCLTGMAQFSASVTSEATEVMARPVIATVPRVAPTVAGTDRRGQVNWIRLAAAGLFVGITAWLLVPVRGMPPQSAADDTTPTAISTTEPGGAQSGVTPPAVAAAPSSAVVSAATQPPASNEAVSEPVPLAEFKNVKWLAVTGTRTSARDVVLTLSGLELVALSTESHDPLATLPYRQIAKATYVNARDPRWDPSFGAPAGKIDVPGFLGRSRHWLTVQTKEAFAILRLDGADRLEVLKTFEGRAGVTIDRPAANDK